MEDKGEVLGYYLLTLTGDIEALRPEDYYAILKYGIYKDLPFIYTKILFECLADYRTEDNYNPYKTKGEERNLKVTARDKETGYFVRYEVPLKPRLGMQNLEDEVYIQFFEHYVLTVNAYYYNTELSNPKAHTAPLQKYKADVLYLYKVMSRYTGKDIAGTYICIYTDTFFTYLDKSKYLGIISDKDKREALHYADTKLGR